MLVVKAGVAFFARGSVLRMNSVVIGIVNAGSVTILDAESDFSLHDHLAFEVSPQSEVF